MTDIVYSVDHNYVAKVLSDISVKELRKRDDLRYFIEGKETTKEAFWKNVSAREEKND